MSVASAGLAANSQELQRILEAAPYLTEAQLEQALNELAVRAEQRRNAAAAETEAARQQMIRQGAIARYNGQQMHNFLWGNFGSY